MKKTNFECLRDLTVTTSSCPILSINKLKIKQKSANAVLTQNTLKFNTQYMKTSLIILSSVSSQEKFIMFQGFLTWRHAKRDSLKLIRNTFLQCIWWKTCEVQVWEETHLCLYAVSWDLTSDRELSSNSETNCCSHNTGSQTSVDYWSISTSSIIFHWNWG